MLKSLNVPVKVFDWKFGPGAFHASSCRLTLWTSPEQVNKPERSRVGWQQHRGSYSSALPSSSFPTTLPRPTSHTHPPTHPPVFPQAPRPDNWDAYSNSVYIVFPLYRVGSGLVEMVVGTTRKPSSLEVNWPCSVKLVLQEGLKPKPLGKSYPRISHCHQFIS